MDSQTNPKHTSFALFGNFIHACQLHLRTLTIKRPTTLRRYKFYQLLAATHDFKAIFDGMMISWTRFNKNSGLWPVLSVRPTNYNQKKYFAQRTWLHFDVVDVTSQLKSLSWA